MKVVAYYEGISIWHAPWDELRPIAGTPNSLLVQILRDVYHFEVVSPSQAAQQVGLFLPFLGQGRFEYADATVGINSLEFRPECIIASCARSEASSAYLFDCINLLTDNLGFRTPSAERRISHRSTIISQFDGVFMDFLPRWSEAVALYNQLKGVDERVVPFNLRFGNLDHRSAAEHELVIEKRLTPSADENWFFTQMNLSTERHEHFLEGLERIFGKQEGGMR